MFRVFLQILSGLLAIISSKLVSFATSPFGMIFQSAKIICGKTLSRQDSNSSTIMRQKLDSEEELEDNHNNLSQYQSQESLSGEIPCANEAYNSVTRDLMQYQKERYQQYLKLKSKLKKRQFTAGGSSPMVQFVSPVDIQKDCDSSDYADGNDTNCCDNNNDSFRDEDQALNMSIERALDDMEGSEQTQEEKQQQQQILPHSNDMLVERNTNIKDNSNPIEAAASKPKKTFNPSRPGFRQSSSSLLTKNTPTLNVASFNIQVQKQQAKANMENLPPSQRTSIPSISSTGSILKQDTQVKSESHITAAPTASNNQSFEESQQLMNSEILKSQLHCYVHPTFLQLKKINYNDSFTFHSDNYCSTKKCPCLKYKRKYQKQYSLPVAGKPLLTIFENLAY